MGMKWGITAALATLSVATMQSAGVGSASVAQGSAAQTTRRPVLVELFTSEGCSTCPQADALLLRLENEQTIQSAEVIAIEEHVDYWNQQGWIDPFSSPEWTLRQQEYVAKLNAKMPYTPQMVVDGQTQFVGSREGQAQEAIRLAAQQEKAEIALTPEKPSTDGTERVKVRVDNLGGLGTGAKVIWLAVTEKGLESAVDAGENSGRDLRHASVLRLLRKLGTVDGKSHSFAATPELKLKSKWNRDNLKIVAFAQDKRDWRILGAAAVTLSK
jgi:hypothetical protein